MQFCYHFEPFAFGRLSLATAFISEWVRNKSSGFHFGVDDFSHGFHFVITIHSKWHSIRNGFGITPKGPMGPSRALGSPWDPSGPLWSPWVPWVPLGSLGSLGFPWAPWGAVGSKGSAPCRSEKRASRTLGGGADSAGENILGRRHARKRIWIFSLLLPHLLSVLERCGKGFR